MYTAAGLLLGVLVMTLLIGYKRLELLDRQLRLLFYIALSTVAFAGVAAVVLTSLNYARNPPEWDFLIFWINGTAAAHGLNYYDPQHAVTLAQFFQPTKEFANEALRKPFLYPPPSILCFLPLGWFDMRMAALLWYAGHFGCLIGAAILLSKTILQDGTRIGLLITAGLLTLLYGTYSNIKTAQTLFLLLLLMTLFFRDRDRFLGGIWVALGILVKPFIVILLAWLLLKKKWSSLLVTFLTLTAASLITLALCGLPVFRSYLTQIDYSALPTNQYIEPQNQSLLAWVLRVEGGSGPESGTYIGLALLFTAGTLWRIWRLSDSREDIAIALCLVLGLLIYPGSLRSYSVLLLIPILLLCRDNRIWPVAVAYAFMVPERGYYVFFATALIWIALMFVPVNGPGQSDRRTGGDYSLLVRVTL